MYVKNPFTIKDWRHPQFITTMIIIQVSFLILTLLNYYGFNIPLITDLFGFVFLIFVPGTLLIRILDLHKLKSKGQIILFTVGLTLVFLMLIGFFINLLFPLFGIIKPLSPLFILLTINIITYGLCVLCYFIDKGRIYKNISRNLNEMVIKKSPPNIYNLKNLISPTLLFPFLLPILSILGSYAMNVYHSNLLTIVMILLIALITFLIGSGRFVPAKLYPLYVFLISISLLFHKSLITNYIWGWDINYEYYLANQVINNAVWNENLPVSYNSMLSVMILAPIFNSFINIGLIWVMKVIYPFIFSLVPAGLYYVFKKQTSAKIAFLATFFMMIQFTFYTEMLSLVRQQIAELMLVLVLVIITSDQLDIEKRSILAVIFGLSIIVAHYGLSYIMMIIFLISVIILYLMEKDLLKWINKYLMKIIRSNTAFSVVLFFSGYFSGVDKKYTTLTERHPKVRDRIIKYQLIQKDKVISSSFLALFMLFLLIWYIYTSNSTIFQSCMDIGRTIIENLYSFMDPNTTQGLSLVMQEQVTPLRNIHKYFYLCTQFFISIGIVALLIKKDGMNFNREYKALSLAAFLVLVAGVLLPFFSSQMNTSRLYHVSLIILAPFCLVGMLTIVNLFNSILNFKQLSDLKLRKKTMFSLISIFLILFLFFDTGLMYQVVDNEHPTSIALNNSYDFPKFNQEEVTASKWLQTNNLFNKNVYADKYRASVLVSFLPCKEIPCYFDLITNNSYIFLGSENVNRGQVLVYKMIGSNIVTGESYQSSEEIVKSRSKIYDNGGSYIFNDINLNFS